MLCSCNIFSSPPAYLTDHPLGTTKGFLLYSSRSLSLSTYKSEYPGEARLGTLLNSHFTTGRSRLFSLYVDCIPSTKRYSIRFLYQTLARISREKKRERLSCRCLSRRRHPVHPLLFAEDFTMFAVSTWTLTVIYNNDRAPVVMLTLGLMKR